MNPQAHSVWLHRFAWITAALTLLLPVTTGAMVTTLKAGMVFSDWPTSEGYFILNYPWLSSARDQFIEHGHRLSGMTIGLVTMCLVVAALCLDRRPLVRKLAIGIFAAVFAQGMLGGARVLLDEQLLALLHGDFAALVLSLMAILVVVTGRNRDDGIRSSLDADFRVVSKSAVVLLLTLIAQYVMGGLLRHLRERDGFGWAWMVHPWFAVVVLLATAWFGFDAYRTPSPTLHRYANALIGLAVAQSLVGLATWYVRYGIPSWGVIAQQNSVPQIVICSMHKVVGMLTLVTGVLAVVVSRPTQSVTPDRQIATDGHSSIMGAAT